MKYEVGNRNRRASPRHLEGGLCPRGTLTGVQETLPTVGLGTGVTCPYKKRPETRTNLPISGCRGQDGPCQQEMPARFVSCTYFLLELTRVDDIIPGHCPAVIKACTRRDTGGAIEAADGEGAPHAGCEQCWRAMGDQASVEQVWSLMGERTQSNIKGQNEPQAQEL